MRCSPSWFLFLNHHKFPKLTVFCYVFFLPQVNSWKAWRLKSYKYEGKCKWIQLATAWSSLKEIVISLSIDCKKTPVWRGGGGLYTLHLARLYPWPGGVPSAEEMDWDQKFFPGAMFTQLLRNRISALGARVSGMKIDFTFKVVGKFVSYEEVYSRLRHREVIHLLNQCSCSKEEMCLHRRWRFWSASGVPLTPTAAVMKLIKQLSAWKRKVPTLSSSTTVDGGDFNILEHPRETTAFQERWFVCSDVRKAGKRGTSGGGDDGSAVMLPPVSSVLMYFILWWLDGRSIGFSLVKRRKRSPIRSSCIFWTVQWTSQWIGNVGKCQKLESLKSQML